MTHHRNQTARALMSKGMIRAYPKFLEAIIEMAKLYRQCRTADPATSSPPFTMYCARLASTSAAYVQLKREDLRPRFQAVPGDWEPNAGQRILVEGGGVPAVGIVEQIGALSGGEVMLCYVMLCYVLLCYIVCGIATADVLSIT